MNTVILLRIPNYDTQNYPSAHRIVSGKESDKFNIQKFVVKKVKKWTCLKWTYGHSGIDYRVATLSKLYLTSTEIIMQS